MRITFFLGAGSSVPFDKPTTETFKDILLQEIKDESFRNYLTRTFLSVPKFSDIEYVLRAIEDAISFSKEYGSDYFSSLQTGHQMFTYGGKSITYSNIINELEGVYNDLKEKVFEHYSWKHNVDEDKNLFAVYEKLFPIIENSSNGIHIFTTNYDQAIENYCDKKNTLVCIDGFRHDEGIRRNVWANGDYEYYGIKDGITNVYLYKLHGSLNWKRHSQYGIVRTDEESISPDKKFIENMVIYPALSPKDGRNNEPYKTILKKFDEQMDRTDMCIVIGFSFRDDHINEVFTKFIEKQNTTLIVLSPNAVTDFHTNLKKENPNEADLESWKNISTENHMDRIYLIQKKVEPKTIDQVKRDIAHVLSTRTT